MKQYFTFLVLFISVALRAQIYPISVTTQLTPPYSVSLADYVAPGNEQLRVIIFQRDLTQAPYRLYLRVRIEHNGREIIRTAEDYMPPPLTVSAGVPTVISGSELSAYLSPENLAFVGYPKEAYLKTKTLPEGSYQITFTAYDYVRREVSLSQGGSQYCYLAKSEPPMLNQPGNNMGVPAMPSQFILFQWLPRNTSSPNSAGSTKYLFELFEMRVEGMPPNDVALSTTPVYSLETEQTSLTYTIAQPYLYRNLRYAWRVRAIDSGGRDYFRNNGYSEVFSFVYGAHAEEIIPPPIVTGLEVKGVSTNGLNATWQASAEYDSYRVQYRIKGNNEWWDKSTLQNKAELRGLKGNTEYDVRVQGKKGDEWSAPCVPVTGKTLTEVIPDCKADNKPLEITNQTPLPTLRIGEEISGGGFPVTIVSVSGENGKFSGTGYVKIPLLGRARIAADFKNIGVNTDYQLISGEIILRSNADTNMIADIDALTEGGAHTGKVVSGQVESSITLSDVAITSVNDIKLNKEKKEITITTPTGNKTIDLSKQLEEGQKTVTIQDKDGNLYSVDTEKGKVTALGKQAAQPATIANKNRIADDIGVVTFDRTKDTQYALDLPSSQYAQSLLFYDEYKTLETASNTPYIIPIKIIPTGETDYVKAIAKLKGNYIAENITFVNSTGTEYKAERTDDEFTLQLPSGKENDGQEIWALYKNGKENHVIGKLLVVSYTTKHPKVTLVPTNGQRIDKQAIKEGLDKIYKPIAIDWQVEVDDNFKPKEVGKIEIDKSGLFSAYTESMKQLNTQYQQDATARQVYDEKSAYLFIVDQSSKAAADMPRGKQYGYVFGRSIDKNDVRTIAHELGHGVFKLKHTFDEQYKIEKNSTDNLMDYNGGQNLVKHQWDGIHAPGIVIGVFEKDEDGMSEAECLVKLNNLYKIIKDKNLLSYLTLVACESNPHKLLKSIKGKEYTVSIYEDPAQHLSITYYRDAWANKLERLFKISVSDSKVLPEDIQNFWVYYHPYDIKSEGSLTMTLALRDAMPLPNEKEDHCYLNVTDFPRGTSAGAAFSDAMASVVLYGALSGASLDVVLTQKAYQCLIGFSIDLGLQIGINALIRTYKNEPISAQELMSDISFPSAATSCATAQLLNECGTACAGISGFVTGIGDDIIKQIKSGKKITEIAWSQSVYSGMYQGLLAAGVQKLISVGINKWNKRYAQKDLEEAIADATKNPQKYGLGVTGAGNKVDDLFASILNQADFQGFRNLCRNNPKVTVELVDDSWHAFASQTKSTYGIGNKRNLATIEFDGQKKIITSGEGYNSQMANSGQFIPEEFITKVKNGERVFEPSIATRHLDTESIGLEYFAKQKGAVKGKKYPEVTGEIKIASDLCPCPSCSVIFQQFSDMFPHVNIKVVTSPKLHY